MTPMILAGGCASSPPPHELRLTVLDWAGYEGAVSYSFDDTQPSQVEHWPALRDTGVRMTFYTWSDVAARSPDTWKDVVAHGSELGDHTVTHKHANEVADPEQELDDCDDFIRSMGQPGVWTMAYPFGDTAWRHTLAGRYLAARTVNNGMVPARGPVAADLTPTFLVQAGQRADTFNGVVDAAADSGSWVVFTFHALLPTPQNWYAGVDVAEVVASIAHAKAGGRVWIDSVARVAAYRRMAETLRATPAVARGQSLTWSWSVPSSFPRGQTLRVTTGGGSLTQGGVPLAWNEAGYYEVAVDAGSLTWTPTSP
jgi:peptidoglycan/xylan/chitin deacetylase (PgdA/CDA1 family)